MSKVNDRTNAFDMRRAFTHVYLKWYFIQYHKLLLGVVQLHRLISYMLSNKKDFHIDFAVTQINFKYVRS